MHAIDPSSVLAGTAPLDLHRAPAPTDAMLEAGYDVLRRIHAGPFEGSPSLGHAQDVLEAMFLADPQWVRAFAASVLTQR